MWVPILLISVIVGLPLVAHGLHVSDIDLGASWYFFRLRRRHLRIVRERRADWPRLTAWATANGWRVRYVELAPWTERMRGELIRWEPEPGPYLMVSGEVDGVAVDVVRVPRKKSLFPFSYRDHTDEYHLVVAPDDRPYDRFRSRDASITVWDGLLVAWVYRWNFPLRPKTIPVTVRKVLAARRSGGGT